MQFNGYQEWVRWIAIKITLTVSEFFKSMAFDA